MNAGVPTLGWLDRLVAFPTVSAETNLPLLDAAEDALRAAGASCERFPDDTGTKAALLARIGPDVAGGLMLSGHVDVVPVEGQDWTMPPFRMTRRDGRLYGRGTADMKGFVAAMLALAQRSAGRTLDRPLARPLWLALSYDEEIGCVGVRPMLAQMAARGIRPDLVVVGEPTSLRPALGHKGKMAFSATATGVPRHSAEAPLALNALHLAADFMSHLRALQTEIAATGPRDDGYCVPHATVHVGKLEGGTVVNLVPAEARMLIEARFLACEDADALAARLRDAARTALAPHVTSFPKAAINLIETGRYPGLATAADAPALRRFAGCLAPGATPRVVDFGTEGGVFAACLGVPVVVCGPGNMDQGHRPDEYVTETDLAACDRMLDAALARFCAAPD